MCILLIYILSVIFASMLGSPERPLPSGEIIFRYINKLNRPLSLSTTAGKTIWQQKVKASFPFSTLFHSVNL